MLLNEKRTTVAYRCPHCGGGIMSAVGLFNLSADMVKLKCTCGKSELKIVYNRDNTVRLTVPCLICAQPHTFTVNSSLFFSDELFVLPCPYSDVNIAFTGEMNAVKAELARTELELLDMLEENGITDFSSLHGDEQDLPDPQILDIILFVIDDLDAEGKIYCHCNPDPAEVPAEADEESRSDRCICNCTNTHGCIFFSKLNGARKQSRTSCTCRLLCFLDIIRSFRKFSF